MRDNERGMGREVWKMRRLKCVRAESGCAERSELALTSWGTALGTPHCSVPHRPALEWQPGCISSVGVGSGGLTQQPGSHIVTCITRKNKVSV